MGGKRPDQYQIDPGEAGATDYKGVRRAEDRIAGHVPDKKERKRQARGRGMIPPKVPNPLVEQVRAAEAERQEHIQKDEDAED